MIGLDTNVVLRLFDRSNIQQTRIAENLIAERAANDDACLLNPIVLAEFVWTLDRTYKLDRLVIADHVERLLQAPEFVVPFLDEAEAALVRYREGAADFADYFLSSIIRWLGCASTMTFDRRAGEDERFTLLTA